MTDIAYAANTIKLHVPVTARMVGRPRLEARAYGNRGPLAVMRTTFEISWLPRFPGDTITGTANFHVPRNLYVTRIAIYKGRDRIVSETCDPKLVMAKNDTLDLTFTLIGDDQ